LNSNDLYFSNHLRRSPIPFAGNRKTYVRDSSNTAPLPFAPSPFSKNNSPKSLQEINTRRTQKKKKSQPIRTKNLSKRGTHHWKNSIQIANGIKFSIAPLEFAFRTTDHEIWKQI